MEEPIYGGLFDLNWFFYHILIHLIMVGSVIGTIYIIGLAFDCPYECDVSSCFSYNLPDWLKIAIPLISIIPLFVIPYFILRYIHHLNPEIIY